MERKYLSKMGKPMYDKSGFTMIETLFVLMIMCMLFCLSWRIHLPVKNDHTKIEEITRFLYQAKLTAMNLKTQVTVTFASDFIQYEWEESSQTFTLDSNDSFESHQLTFNENGNIQGAKTLTYYCGNQVYTLVYQIGSGSFYVQ